MVKKAMVEGRADIGILVDAPQVPKLACTPLAEESIFLCGRDPDQLGAGDAHGTAACRRCPSHGGCAAAGAAVGALLDPARAWSASPPSAASRSTSPTSTTRRASSARSTWPAPASPSRRRRRRSSIRTPSAGWLRARVVEPDLSRSYQLALPTGRAPSPAARVVADDVLRAGARAGRLGRLAGAPAACDIRGLRPSIGLMAGHQQTVFHPRPGSMTAVPASRLQTGGDEGDCVTHPTSEIANVGALVSRAARGFGPRVALQSADAARHIPGAGATLEPAGQCAARPGPAARRPRRRRLAQLLRDRRARSARCYKAALVEGAAQFAPVARRGGRGRRQRRRLPGRDHAERGPRRSCRCCGAEAPRLLLLDGDPARRRQLRGRSDALPPTAFTPCACGARRTGGAALHLRLHRQAEGGDADASATAGVAAQGRHGPHACRARRRADAVRPDHPRQRHVRPADAVPAARRCC